MTIVTVVVSYVAIEQISPQYWYLADDLGSVSVSSLSFWKQWLVMMLRTLRRYVTADVLFYSLHRLMHEWNWLRARTHTLHHSSFASGALGGYYMDVFDFFAEHGPLFVSWAFWQQMTSAIDSDAPPSLSL